MKRRSYGFVCLALILTSCIAAAQVVTKGTIMVIVTDPQGARLPGAVVSAEAADTVTVGEATTNHNGVATCCVGPFSLLRRHRSNVRLHPGKKRSGPGSGRSRSDGSHHSEVGRHHGRGDGHRHLLRSWTRPAP